MSTATITSKIAKLQSLITVANLLSALEKTVKAAVLPLTGIVMFLFLWQATASNIVTSHKNHLHHDKLVSMHV